MMGQQQQQQQGPGIMMPGQNQPGMQQQQVNMPNQGAGMIRPMMGQNQVNIGQPQMNPMMNQGPIKGNLGPNVGPMNPQMMNQMVPNVANVPGQMQGGNQPQLNQMMNQNNPGMMPGGQMMPGVRGMAPNPGIMNPMNTGQQQQQQIMNMQQQMRKQDMMMTNQGPQQGPFPQQVRNVAPNFLRQSPSPMSVPSPIGLSQSQHNTMVASPAMVPSPQAPQRPGMQNVMAPSPSANMNTPGQPQGDYVQSPMNPHDDQIYREKYNQLTKYKEPLKKVIQRVGPENNSEKLTKLKKLLEILSNPEARIPLETLVKCEIVLVNQFGTLKDNGPTSINNPLYDAIQNNLQNPLANHTIQRTFKPSLEAWFGPDIKNMPPAKKRRVSDEQVVPNVPEIPHALQGEIARLDAKFKISIDQTAHTTGAKNIKLICSLNDDALPCVPPINITIPEDYPMASPQCTIMEHNTNFLVSVEKALKARISKLPELFSLTHILETWTLAIRQACNPSSYVEPCATSVLLAV
jgi:mediator of RNA polymerase II transcription subunit 15